MYFYHFLQVHLNNSFLIKVMFIFSLGYIINITSGTHDHRFSGINYVIYFLEIKSLSKLQK